MKKHLILSVGVLMALAPAVCLARSPKISTWRVAGTPAPAPPQDDYVSDGATPISQEDLEELLCALRVAGMGDIADEIEASQTSSPGAPKSWEFYEGPGEAASNKIGVGARTYPDRKQTWVRKTRPVADGAGGTEKLSIIERASFLAHEWHHTRQLCGKPFFPQLTSAQARGSCAHAEAYKKELEFLCQWLLGDRPPNNPDGTPPCGGSLVYEDWDAAWERAHSKWVNRQIMCDKLTWNTDYGEDGLLITPLWYLEPFFICS
jgi:hypothetical protein